MHADIMYIQSHAFLLGVFQPIDLTVVSTLDAGRQHPALRVAVEEQLNLVEKKGFQVPVLHCDNEFKDEHVEAAIGNRNMTFNVVGPGQHEPVSERKLRLVKERTRSVLHSLPYALPSKLLLYLVLFVTFGLNIIPVKCNGKYLSPREILTGRKVNYKRDLRFQFGEYIQATSPNVVSNTMQSRTDGDIALLSTGNIEGTIYAYNIATKRIVKRDRWKVLPIPDIVIKVMNELAEADDPDRRVPKDPIFRIGTGTQETTPYDWEQDADLGGEFPDAETASPVNELIDYQENENPQRLNGANEGPLAIKIPRKYWNEGTEQSWKFRLDNDVVRDEDGDVVMDLSDSIEYVNLLISHSGQSYLAQQAEIDALSLTARPNETNSVAGKIFRMTVARACEKHGHEKALAVVRSELKQIIDRGVCQGVHWEFLTEADRRSAIRCSIFLKEKYKPDGCSIS